MGIMTTPCAILALLSILLAFAINAESRNDPAGAYWRNVMKDQPMPKALEGLIVHNSDSAIPKNSNEKTNCHETQNSFTEDFEPTPNVSAYPDDAKLAGTSTKDNENVGPKAERKFAQEFKPGPHATGYSG